MFRGFLFLILAVFFAFALIKFWPEFTGDHGLVSDISKAIYRRLPIYNK